MILSIYTGLDSRNSPFDRKPAIEPKRVSSNPSNTRTNPVPASESKPVRVKREPLEDKIEVRTEPVPDKSKRRAEPCVKPLGPSNQHRASPPRGLREDSDEARPVPTADKGKQRAEPYTSPLRTLNQQRDPSPPLRSEDALLHRTKRIKPELTDVDLALTPSEPSWSDAFLNSIEQDKKDVEALARQTFYIVIFNAISWEPHRGDYSELCFWLETESMFGPESLQQLWSRTEVRSPLFSCAFLLNVVNSNRTEPSLRFSKRPLVES